MLTEFTILRRQLKEKYQRDLAAIARVEKLQRLAISGRTRWSPKGSVVKAVRDVLPRLPAVFTWRTVKITLDGEATGAIMNEQSVRQALRRCEALQLIEVCKTGAGRALSTYRLRQAAQR